MFSPLFFQGCAVPWVLMHSVVSSDSKFTILKTEVSPRTLEWVAYAFSSRSSQPRNWTRVSCIAGRFFTNWAIREVKKKKKNWANSLNYICCQISDRGVMSVTPNSCCILESPIYLGLILRPVTTSTHHHFMFWCRSWASHLKNRLSNFTHHIFLLDHW